MPAWSEGYGASNIVIRGNVFDSCNPAGAVRPNDPDLNIDVYLKRDPSVIKTRFPILKEVLIEINRFLSPTGAIVTLVARRAYGPRPFRRDRSRAQRKLS